MKAVRMRRWPVCSMAIAVVFAPHAGWAAPEAPPRVAPQAFVPIRTNTYALSGYLDVAHIARSRDEVTFSLLIVGERYQRPLGELVRYSVSCAWGSFRAVPGWIGYSEPAQARPEPPNEPETHPRFASPGSVEATAITMVCDPGSIPPDTERLTFTQAFTQGADALKGLTPPLPVPPVAHRPFSDVFRLSPVYRNRLAGVARFVDWANMRRQGRTVMAVNVDILEGDAPPDTPSVIARMVTYDCSARTLSVAATLGYTASGQRQFAARAQQPPRPIAVGSADATVMAAACSGEEPKTTFGSIADAVASTKPAAATSERE